jgi:2-keto-4-pentenoate hydratase
MSLTEVVRQEAAERLLAAEQQRLPMEPLTELYPSIDVADAYDIQLRGIRAKTAAGARIVGKKVGLTSKAMQAAFGIETPDYGHLLDNMRVEHNATVQLATLLRPRIEVELAFVLAKTLRGPGVDVAQVLAATRYVTPSFEIIDSRIRDWKLKLADTIADNGSSAAFVLGTQNKPVGEVDLRLVGMVLQKNGEDIDTAAGAAVLGNPAAAVAWLANAFADYGIALEADEVILPGSLCKAYVVESGDTFTASMDGLGSVSVTFA